MPGLLFFLYHCKIGTPCSSAYTFIFPSIISTTCPDLPSRRVTYERDKGIFTKFTETHKSAYMGCSERSPKQGSQPSSYYLYALGPSQARKKICVAEPEFSLDPLSPFLVDLPPGGYTPAWPGVASREKKEASCRGMVRVESQNFKVSLYGSPPLLF